MCGIAGVVARRNLRPTDTETTLCAITQRMETRGPDAEGVWISPRKMAGFGHRRLSIIDPQARSDPFNEVVRALMQVHGEAKIEYIPFPADLKERYQHFTESDLTGLRATGCDLEMTPLEEGVRETFSAQEAALV